jgi:quinol monooxygenase YgiN
MDSNQKLGFNLIAKNKQHQMKYPILRFVILLTIVVLFSSGNQENKNTLPFTADRMLIRIAELEIDGNFLDEYAAILKEESEASVRMEPGVICMYPIFEKEHPSKIRILEIYADQEAYQVQLQTPHFKKYKSRTAAMVKSLNLIAMEALDERTIPQLFKKFQNN